jgi:hypothetical protein
MPSRLIQLNGMNINAGGPIEFRATMQPASQVNCAKALGLEICVSVKISLCNFDHIKKIAARPSQISSTIFFDQPSSAPMCKMWVEPMVINVNQMERSWRSPRQQNTAKPKQEPDLIKRRVARSWLHTDL